MSQDGSGLEERILLQVEQSCAKAKAQPGLNLTERAETARVMSHRKRIVARQMDNFGAVETSPSQRSPPLTV